MNLTRVSFVVVFLLQAPLACRDKDLGQRPPATAAPPSTQAQATRPSGGASVAPPVPKPLTIDEQLERVFSPTHVLPPYTGPKVSAIVGGCAILSDESVRCFEQSIPGEQPRLSKAGLFSDGSSTGCFGGRDGQVWCWGTVKSHVLDPQKSCRWEPWPPQPEGEDRACPNVGGFHYCGFDQLCARPVALRGLREVVQLEGREQACALRRDGQVWCWGANGNLEGPGQGRCKLPDGFLGALTFGEEPCFDPKQVLGIPPMTSITLGPGRSCALTADGRLFCWGDLPATYPRRMVHTFRGEGSLPMEQTQWPKLKQVLLMGGHICGLSPEGRMLCQHDLEDVPQPVAGFENVSEIRGDGLVCGLRTGGEVWCTVNPEKPVPLPAPRRVPGIIDAVQLSTNYVSACAVQKDGSAYCWGNWHYQGKFGPWPPMPAL